jgi:predicted enzyme related to lactoylglutathione lyase
MIKDLAFVAYSVRDVPAATAFYRDVIGLKPGDMVSEHWAEFDVGSTTFGLGNGTPLGIEPGSCFAATFEVDDVDAEQQRLKAAGVEIGDVHDTPVCRVAFATDPEGNRFGLHQRKTA